MFQDAPGVHVRGDRGGFGKIDHLAEELVDEHPGKQVFHVGTDAVLPGGFQVQPPLHALALHNDDFRLQGRQRVSVQARSHFLLEDFETVAGVKMQSGHVFPVNVR